MRLTTPLGNRVRVLVPIPLTIISFGAPTVINLLPRGQDVLRIRAYLLKYDNLDLISHSSSTFWFMLITCLYIYSLFRVCVGVSSSCPARHECSVIIRVRIVTTLVALLLNRIIKC